MRIDKTAASSKIQGLGYVTLGTADMTISSFSFGAGATQTFTTTMTATVQDATSLTRAKFSGVGNGTINNTWTLIPGAMSFRNTGYDVGILIDRTISGQLITVQFYNSTGGSVTVPTITVSIKSYFYTAPW